MMNKRNIIINVTIIFTLATIWQMICHEGGHFIAAILLGAKDVALFHNYASYNSSGLSLNATIFIAAAGPVTSLFIAILFHLICSTYTKRNILFLFFLYMSALSYISFFGYLMISPIFVNGDTGFIFSALNFPLWLKIVCALIGVALGYLFMKKLAPYFLQMLPANLTDDKKVRKQALDTIIESPLYWGIAVTVLLNLPVVTSLSLIYPACSPFALYWPHGYAMEIEGVKPNSSEAFEKLNKLSPLLIVLLTITIAVNRLLAMGLHW